MEMYVKILYMGKQKSMCMEICVVDFYVLFALFYPPNRSIIFTYHFTYRNRTSYLFKKKVITVIKGSPILIK